MGPVLERACRPASGAARSGCASCWQPLTPVPTPLQRAQPVHRGAAPVPVPPPSPGRRQVVAPVVPCLARTMVVTLDQALVLAHDLAFGGNHQAIRVDPQAHGSVGEWRRHAVAVALEVDQAGGRDSLRVLNKAIEGTRYRHQGSPLRGPDIRNGTRQLAVLDLVPQGHTTLLKPIIELHKAREWRHDLPQAMAGIAHVLLHLALLPARRGIAELGLEQEVADHGCKARIDVALLATAHPVY